MRPANLQLTDYCLFVHNKKWKLVYKDEEVESGPYDGIEQIHEVIEEYVKDHHMIFGGDPAARTFLKKYHICREEE